MPIETKEPMSGAGQATDTAELDPTALLAIRNLIETQDEPPAPPPPVAEATVREAQEMTVAHPAPPRAAPKPAPAPAPLGEAPQAPQQAPQPVQETIAPDAAAVKSPGRIARATARAKAKILGYRPTRKHITLAALTALVVFRPWLVVGVVLMTIFSFVCVLLVLGYDGFWQRAMGVARWYARRRPSKAAELHRKLDSFAMKWDAVLDRFPEGTVDALYLPDFGDVAVAEKRHEEAMDRRLATLREGEA